MNAPTLQEQSSLQRISQVLNAGDHARAADLAADLVRASPRLAIAHHIHGAALNGAGRQEAAEKALRQALKLDPALSRAAVTLSEILVSTDRAAEARDVLAPFVARPSADILVLTADASALKSLRRSEEALATYERARVAAPKSGVAEHNLASLLGDMKRYADSEAAVQRAFAKGLDAAETWLVRARSLQGLGELDAAVAAYREAIRRRPGMVDAHGGLSQLVWMQTEDLAASAEALDIALRAYPDEPGLWLARSRLLEYVAGSRAGYEALMLAPAAVRATEPMETAAANLAASFDPALSLVHARGAFAAAPDQMMAVGALGLAQLANGDPEAAVKTALIIRNRWSLNQYGIALLATAWRLLGMEAYHELYDYDRFVKSFQLETPEGWGSLQAYIDDLAEALALTHKYRGHPIGQSLREGTQGELNPTGETDPAIAAFFPTLRKAIGHYIQGLGHGGDPLRARISDDFVFAGAWSVRLRPGGYHANHIHPMGWLSSACHLVTPPSVDQGHEGWLTFGQPGIPTLPMLEAEHFVKPEPGVLVLFPSYMWHGTAPFHDDAMRLTAAFDVLPG